MNKNILFSAFCKTTMHIGIVKGLVKMLKSKGYSIDVLSDQNMDVYNTDSRLNLFNAIPQNDYVAIIAFNLKGYNKVRNFRKQNNIPLIYALCSSDIDKEYLFDTKLFERILLINDSRNFYPNAFPVEFTTNIAIPFELTPEKSADCEESNIVVCANNATLLKIIPVLNNHGEYHFTVISEKQGSTLNKLINGNIDVVKAKKNELDKHILNSQGVIGSGEFILRSLLLEKPSIVVGPYGFGRLVSLENINQQFHSLFQGRVGAQYGEIIPFNLLSNEIENLMNNEEDRKAELKQLRSFLEEQHKFTSYILDNLINTIILKSDIWDTKLILSSSYYFIKYDNQSFVAVDSRMMKIHSLITDTEYQKIKAFETGARPGEIYNQIGKADKRSYSGFFEKMKTNKILVPYEK